MKYRVESQRTTRVAIAFSSFNMSHKRNNFVDKLNMRNVRKWTHLHSTENDKYGDTGILWSNRKSLKIWLHAIAIKLHHIPKHNSHELISVDEMIIYKPTKS